MYQYNRKKKQIASVCGSWLFCTTLAFAGNLGVNYDPVHSSDFIQGIGLNNTALMQEAIEKDLDLLKELRKKGVPYSSIDHIKVFFTQFNTKDNQVLNIADVVHDWNQKNTDYPVKLTLGVYEFRPERDGCTSQQMCAEWTQVQIEAVKKAITLYGASLIDSVIVGNEDVASYDPAPAIIKERILKDINTLLPVTQHTIPIGTAQRSDDILDMLKNPNSSNAAIAKAADLLGTNIYPFWGKESYAKSAATIKNYWKSINQYKQGKMVQITEEGWPSAGSNWGKATPSARNAFNYFQYWLQRDNAAMDISRSYYFALIDKVPGHDIESHWGIYSSDRNSSLLDQGHTKPRNPNTKAITFVNQFTQQVLINACVEDVPNQTQCYPIGGYNGTGTINQSNKVRTYIDSSGQYYKSILVIFPGQGNAYPRLCYMSLADLQGLKDNQVVNLQWINDSGAGICGQD